MGIDALDRDMVAAVRNGIGFSRVTSRAGPLYGDRPDSARCLLDTDRLPLGFAGVQREDLLATAAAQSAYAGHARRSGRGTTIALVAKTQCGPLIQSGHCHWVLSPRGFGIVGWL
jgi:hypothetical protein